MQQDKLYEKIEKLKRKRNDYLESDDNKNAQRITKQIENIEMQLELLKFKKVEFELSIYKQIVNKYPNISLEVSNLLQEQKNKRKEI